MKNLTITSLIILFTATFVHADLTAIGNLSTATSGQRTYTTTDWLAIAFHTGAAPSNGGWTNFSFSVQTHDGSWPAGGEIQLWSETAGEPGWHAKSYTVPGTQPAGGLVTVADTTSYKLLENHDYFLLINATSGAADTQMTTDTTTIDLGAALGWTLGNSLWESSDSGSSWSETTGERLQASIGVDVIPEPATISLIALLGGGILAVRRFFLI